MKILRTQIRRYWMILTAAAAIMAPLQSVHGADGPVDGFKGLVKGLHRDLNRVAYLTDVVTKKLEAQDSAVCAGGRELERLNNALVKMSRDYAALSLRVSLEAPDLGERVQEESQGALQILTFFKSANLKSYCSAAASGASANAIAHMNITLQVTHKDVNAQRAKTSQLELDAATQSAYAAQNPVQAAPAAQNL